jgi:hypothetical protein
VKAAEHPRSVVLPLARATSFDLPPVCVYTGRRDDVVWHRAHIERTPGRTLAAFAALFAPLGLFLGIALIPRHGLLSLAVACLTMGWIPAAAGAGWVGGHRIALELPYHRAAWRTERVLDVLLAVALVVLWFVPPVAFVDFARDEVFRRWHAAALGGALAPFVLLAVVILRRGQVRLRAVEGDTIEVALPSAAAAAAFRDALEREAAGDVCRRCGDFARDGLCPPCTARRAETVAELAEARALHLPNTALLHGVMSLFPFVPVPLAGLVFSARALRRDRRGRSRPGMVRAGVALALSVLGLAITIVTLLRVS